MDITALNAGSTPARLGASSFKSIGDVGLRVYGGYDAACGFGIEGLLPDAEIFPGGQITGGACWIVRSDDVASLKMFAEAGGRVWFSLHRE